MRNVIAILTALLVLSSVAMAQTKGEVRKNTIGMELVLIPKGEFMMGSTDEEVNEAFRQCKMVIGDMCEREWYTSEMPKHKVTIKDDFWMGKYEVTQGQWQAVMGSNPSYFKGCGANCPVEKVLWSETQEFIKKLNAKNDGYVYSLPSEAQWEYACRAGTTGDYYGNLDSIAWYGKNSGNTTHSVGQKAPNAFGLYDMSGNVSEWVEDIYSENGYAGSPTDGSANTSVGDPSHRVVRGAGWDKYGGHARSAFRIWDNSRDRDSSNGFRVASRPR